jgi:hypothetical protein
LLSSMRGKSAMAEKSKHVESSFIDPLSLFRAGERATENWSRGLGMLSTEMAGFTLARMREHANAWTAIVSDTSASALFDVQRQFVQKAATDYLEEAGKLSRLLTQIATDSFMKPVETPPVGEQVRRAAE